jgi:hypothetical protein
MISSLNLLTRSQSPARPHRSSENEYIKMLIRLVELIDARSQTFESGQLRRKGNVFLEPWEGFVLSRIEVRGVAIGIIRFGDSGLQIVVDDGTGRITAVAWGSSMEQSTVCPPPHTFYNKFVSIKGQLSGFRTELQIRIEDFAVIADQEEPTEESHWWLDVKDQWENLAVAARFRTISTSSSSSDHCCPCLCHSSMVGVPTPCRTLGKSSYWPPSFVRAVAVVSSALRSLTRPNSSPIALSLTEIIGLVKANLAESSSLSVHECYPDCATVEAVRELTRFGFIEPHDETLLIHHDNQRQEVHESPKENVDCPRYPMTPIETLLTQPNQPVIDLRLGRKILQ